MKSDLFHDVARAYYGISPELYALSQKYAAKSMPGQTNLFDNPEGNAAETEEGKAAASPKKADAKKRSSKKTDSKTVNPNFPPPKKQPKSSPGQMEMFQEPDQYAGEDEAGQTPSLFSSKLTKSIGEHSNSMHSLLQSAHAISPEFGNAMHKSISNNDLLDNPHIHDIIDSIHSVRHKTAPIGHASESQFQDFDKQFDSLLGNVGIRKVFPSVGSHEHMGPGGMQNHALAKVVNPDPKTGRIGSGHITSVKRPALLHDASGEYVSPSHVELHPQHDPFQKYAIAENYATKHAPSPRSLYRQHLASAGAKEVEPGVFELPRNRGREFRQKMAKLNLWPDQQFGTKQGNWKFVLYQDNEGDDNSPYALGDAQFTGTGEPAPYAIPDAKAKAKRWKRPRGKKGKLPEKNCATACK